jgi:ribosomal protein S18 acetylase RimI-like enzyme
MEVVQLTYIEEEFEFRQNNSSYGEILEHLRSMDYSHLNGVKSLAELDIYAKKLATNSERFEYWKSSELIGILCFYINTEKKLIFITNISIDENYRGNGLAKKLILELIDRYQKDLKYAITLNVGGNNLKALSLYKKMGFSLEEKVGSRFNLKKTK